MDNIPRSSHKPGIVVSSGAFAPEPVDAVDAFPAIGARIGQTFVDVGLAMLASVTRNATAAVPEFWRRMSSQGILSSIIVLNRSYF